MDNNRAYIAIENGGEIEGKKQEIVSFYEHTPYGRVCCGDLDITFDEIFEVENPFFLSDVFVFCKKHCDIFTIGEVDMICFIKVNAHNQIEEMGTDFVSRFHSRDFYSILKRKDVKRANDIHKILFSMIGDEYWCSKYRQEKTRK